MSNHQKFIALALRLIAKHGRNVTFKVINSTPADADKPWRGTATPPTPIGPLKAVFVPFRGFEFGSEFTDNALFKEVEQICMVAGGQGNLETTHLITDSGKDYKVEWIQRLRPGGQTILYAFGVS